MFALAAPALLALGIRLASGGSLSELSRLRIRWWPLAVLALVIQIPLYTMPLPAGNLVVPLATIATTAIVLVMLLRNAAGPTRVACIIAAAGVALNLTVIVANGGFMPRAGALAPRPLNGPAEAGVVSNTVPMTADTRLAWLGDTIPEPAWLPAPNLVSLGDLLLSLGAAAWVLAGLGVRFTWSPVRRRDVYIAGVTLAALALFVQAATHPTHEPWNALGILALFVAMVIAERMSVPLPKNAAISIASIPHIMALLLLPAWLAMLIAGASMIVDQVLARAPLRKMLFNTASVALTIGATAMVADRIGLGRSQLDINQWQQVPLFLVIACTYYGLTNLLVAVVVALGAERPVHHVFLDNVRFVLPAEFAVCGIGGLVTIIWLICPAWTPLVLFPAIVSQVAFVHVTSSKRNQQRLEFVAEASRVLALSLDRDDLSTSVVHLAVPALCDAAMVLAANDATGVLEPIAHASAEGSVAGQVPPHIAVEVLADGCTRSFDCGIAVCVGSGTRKSGVLCALRGPDRPFDAGDIETTEELARRYAVALENARLHAEAQHASRIRDDFLSIAAHELKTPVTSLRGYAQLLLRSGDSPEPAILSRGLQTIETQADKLSQLTGKLLDVSRIDSGKLRLEPREVDLAVLVRSAVVTAQDATVLHEIHLQAPRSVRAWIDPLRFEQVLANLLSNAIKYSPDGGSIDVCLEAVSVDCVRLSVRDHGLGIPPDRRERLFDRMYQAHGDGYLSGLGLGLFISRQIVELHGGTIDAEFPEDGGTQMTLRLPTRRDAEGTAQQENSLAR